MLSGSPGEVLEDLCRRAIREFSRLCHDLGIECVGDELVDAWRVIEKLAVESGELILVKYALILPSCPFVLKFASNFIIDVLSRDLLVLIEKGLSLARAYKPSG